MSVSMVGSCSFMTPGSGIAFKFRSSVLAVVDREPDPGHGAMPSDVRRCHDEVVDTVPQGARAERPRRELEEEATVLEIRVVLSEDGLVRRGAACERAPELIVPGNEPANVPGDLRADDDPSVPALDAPGQERWGDGPVAVDAGRT